jgi:hypothetical protein
LRASLWSSSAAPPAVTAGGDVLDVFDDRDDMRIPDDDEEVVGEGKESAAPVAGSLVTVT